ncbi:hypothetical protein [Sphingomonas sp. ABOLF]|uniref:hypothetical protein n=1 Tax=Sphingomonas sp. ABOLF TaxID=1985879 RepID=UPI000F7F787B|nr:hypothetical protein [Sphingomonas sp. ABOLF]
MGEVEEAEAGEQVEVGRFQADALADLGRPAEPLVEADDGGCGHLLFFVGARSGRSRSCQPSAGCCRSSA